MKKQCFFFYLSLILFRLFTVFVNKIIYVHTNVDSLYVYIYIFVCLYVSICNKIAKKNFFILLYYLFSNKSTWCEHSYTRIIIIEWEIRVLWLYYLTIYYHHTQLKNNTSIYNHSKLRFYVCFHFAIYLLLNSYCVL